MKIISYFITLVLFCVALVACNTGSSTTSGPIPNPSLTWIGTKQLGAVGVKTSGSGVATDSNGNVYVVGYTYGGLDGNTLTGTIDAFITQYDSTGTRQWTRQLGVTGVQTKAYGVATDNLGHVYVTGTTYGVFSSNTVNTFSNFFLAQYDSAGTLQWLRQLGAAGANTFGTGVATNSSGNVYVTGYTYGGLDGNTPTGPIDGFVTRYDSTGARYWTNQFGVIGVQTYAYGVATDNLGHVYVTGTTQGGLYGNTLTGTTDFFLSQYDSAGTRNWTHQLGVAFSATEGRGVATDKLGHVYVAGYTNGALDGNTQSGPTDFFVTQYDSSGNKQWTRQLGVAAAPTYGYAVATDSADRVDVAGATTGALDGNTQSGFSDFFLTQYDSTGNKQWSRQLGVPFATTYGYAVATDTSDNAFVAGETSGGLDGNIQTGLTDSFVTKYDSAGVKQ